MRACGIGAEAPTQLGPIEPRHLPVHEAAVEAVSKWRFTPTLLNGTPVPVVMTVTVGFTLKR